MTYDVALLPGDGIGPEVVGEAVRVLERVERASGGEIAFRLETLRDRGGRLAAHGGGDLGRGVHRLRGRRRDAARCGRATGRAAPRRTRGGIGRDVPPPLRPRPLRGDSSRPALRRVPDAAARPGAGIDYVIVRENIEGLYAGRHGGSRVEGEVAADTSIVTRSGTQRIVEQAFAVAAARSGAPADGVSRVTCVDKANVLASYAFFREVATEVAATHPEIAFDALYVDAAALYLVQRPSTFDVLVAENMFGDILSDLGAGTVGGLGLTPSGDVGNRHGLFQASHGSAPDIAGRGSRTRSPQSSRRR